MRSIEDQLANEKLMLDLGINRIKSQTNKRQAANMESLTIYGETLCSFNVDIIINHLRAVRKKIEKGIAGKNYGMLTPLLNLPPQQVAAASIRTVIDTLSSRPTLHQLSSSVIERIWIETMLDRATDNELKKYKRGRHKKRYRIFLINNMINTETWDSRQKMASGLFMVELIQKYTELIEIFLDNSTKTPRRMVRATEKCMNWITKVNTDIKVHAPNYLPLLIKPKHYSNPYDGGYYNKNLRYELFKSNNKQIAATSTGAEPFYQVANIQGDVSYRINNYILDQILSAYDNNLEIGCLLTRDGYAVPPYPKQYDEDSPEVIRWRINCKRIIDLNNKTQGSRIGIAKTLWLAKKYRHEERLYFPKQLDFRGRVYDKVPFLNIQGNDVSRSLLEFTDGKLIKTTEDLNWLKIHGANMYGIKQDFKTKIDWVDENINYIYESARDCWHKPEFWMRADKAWSFLAFCRSIYLYSQAPDTYLCGLPCHLDCTCSSIQHYSALLRSTVMGAKVNLINSDKPQDIYSNVATKVNQFLRNSNDIRSQEWLKLSVDRSLTKPCVMTAPYAATNSAFYHYAFAWAQERATKILGKNNWTRRKGNMSAVNFMANILMKESSKEIEPAFIAMKYFKAIGRQVAKNNKSIMWTSPTGLHVEQKYTDEKKTRIQLRYLSDVYLDIRTNKETNLMNTRKMGHAISANILHSFDSSHMALSTIHASIDGVENIAGIHDCFVTTPSEMSVLRNSVRHTFAEMYSVDRLTKLKAELKAQLTEKQIDQLPAEPMLGDLDVGRTKNSNYFIT
tara:strand:+ start:2720 stop:5095 length:2376 start_codon:yes stop_codon:yes gene_type:complete